MALLLAYGSWFTNPYRTAKDNAFHLFWLRLSEAKPRQALSVSFCCGVFCSVTPTYRNAQATSSFFIPAKFTIVHSSSPPAAGRRLFRALIHLDLGRGPFCR